MSAAGIFVSLLQISSDNLMRRKLQDFYFFPQLGNFSFVSVNFLVCSLNCSHHVTNIVSGQSKCLAGPVLFPALT